MFKFRHKLAKAALVAGSAVVTTGLMWVGLRLDRASETDAAFAAAVAENDDTVSHSTFSISPSSQQAHGNVCGALGQYPKVAASLSFHSNVISNICQPFIKYSRPELDRCGDQRSDPYLSKFTWPSRAEMSRRGKVNVFTEAAYTARLPEMMHRAEELRDRATDLCCGPNDVRCRAGMHAVKFDVCKPSSDPNAPDPCVFGGTFRMPGTGYDAIFRAIAHAHGDGEALASMHEIATHNLLGRGPASSEGVQSGSITLSSYISIDSGSASMEPVILHELGHACSMVRMEEAATDSSQPVKALHATEWLDSAKRRCDPNFKFPEAADDFWESVGESRELSSCLKDLASLNQKKLIDKPCNGLCPGHYLEESVGIAFSLLLGDLDGSASAVFPNTCDHVRDGQHPMVSDVAECLLQTSPRFRSRMAQAYGCSSETAPIIAGQATSHVAGMSAPHGSTGAAAATGAKVTKTSL